MNTKEALEEYVRVSEEFLNYVDGGKAEGLLAEEVTHEEYDVWVSEKRKKEFSKDLARLWQVHVTPRAQKEGEVIHEITREEKVFQG